MRMLQDNWALAVLGALLLVGGGVRSEVHHRHSGDFRIDADHPAFMDGEEASEEERMPMPMPKPKPVEQQDVFMIAAKDADAMLDPGMQDLARHLRSFHQQNEPMLRRAQQSLDGDFLDDLIVPLEDMDDAVAEERAIRKRTRVRRRNNRNNVKRTNRNSNRQSVTRRRSTKRTPSPSNGVRRQNGRGSNRRRTGSRRQPQNVRRSNGKKGKNGKRRIQRIPVRTNAAQQKRRRPSNRRRAASSPSSAKNKNRRRNANNRRAIVRNDYAGFVDQSLRQSLQEFQFEDAERSAA